MTDNTYILPTAITVICTSVLFTLMKYFSSRKQIETKHKLPEISEKWWKHDDKMSISTANIKPYYVSFSQQLVKDLQSRLNNTRKDSIKNYNGIQKILDCWENGYDFEKREKYINKYMHFTTNIQGLDIHFIHVKPTSYGQKKILPLLMLHGWPNSIMEFYKIIPLLVTPRQECDFVFEVIVPSLPGFGFSSGPTLDGFSCADMSVILKNLMLRLGHNQFYVQGSDWGIFIARIMSSLFPKHALGTYTTMSASLNKKINSFYSSLAQLNKGIYSSYSSLPQLNKQLILSNKLLVDMKYFQIQAMKPETIGVGLNDSPAGLAAYIIEKFLIGTNYSEINDEFLQKYSYDDLINNLMIYWTSKSITTAMRIYDRQFTELESEFLEKLINTRKVKAPFSFVSLFFGNTPKISAVQEQLANCILHPYTVRNSSFPAFEEPEHFADDIWGSILYLVTDGCRCH